jgi:hypothetical protein
MPVPNPYKTAWRYEEDLLESEYAEAYEYACMDTDDLLAEMQNYEADDFLARNAKFAEGRYDYENYIREYNLRVIN